MYIMYLFVVQVVHRYYIFIYLKNTFTIFNVKHGHTNTWYTYILYYSIV